MCCYVCAGHGACSCSSKRLSISWGSLRFSGIGPSAPRSQQGKRKGKLWRKPEGWQPRVRCECDRLHSQLLPTIQSALELDPLSCTFKKLPRYVSDHFSFSGLTVLEGYVFVCPPSPYHVYFYSSSYEVMCTDHFAVQSLVGISRISFHI